MDIDLPDFLLSCLKRVYQLEVGPSDIFKPAVMVEHCCFSEVVCVDDLPPVDDVKIRDMEYFVFTLANGGVFELHWTEITPMITEYQS